MPTQITHRRTQPTADGPHNGDYGVVLRFPGIATTAVTGTVGGVTGLVEEFLACHRGHTAAAYRRDLTDYLAYCATETLLPLQARRVDLARYLQALEGRGLSPATIARRLVTLRGFYGYCVEEELLAASPAARLRTRRERSQTRIRALSLTELTRLLQASDAHGPRASALTWVLATTGLRISEACGARLEDLHATPDGYWLDVTCKGNLRRSVPLLEPALQRVHAASQGRSDGPLFPTRTGTALDRHSAARTLRALATDLGLTPFSPHVLRHTFVTLARAHGCALEDVQDAAGHADPATTRRYDRTVQGAARHPGQPLLAALATVTGSGTAAFTGADHPQPSQLPHPAARPATSSGSFPTAPLSGREFAGGHH